MLGADLMKLLESLEVGVSLLRVDLELRDLLVSRCDLFSQDLLLPHVGLMLGCGRDILTLALFIQCECESLAESCFGCVRSSHHRHNLRPLRPPIQLQSRGSADRELPQDADSPSLSRSERVPATQHCSDQLLSNTLRVVVLRDAQHPLFPLTLKVAGIPPQCVAASKLSRAAQPPVERSQLCRGAKSADNAAQQLASPKRLRAVAQLPSRPRSHEQAARNALLEGVDAAAEHLTRHFRECAPLPECTVPPQPDKPLAKVVELLGSHLAVLALDTESAAPAHKRLRDELLALVAQCLVDQLLMQRGSLCLWLLCRARRLDARSRRWTGGTHRLDPRRESLLVPLRVAHRL